MKSSLGDEVRRTISGMDEQQNGKAQDVQETTEQEQRPDETIHIHYFPDAVVILKEDNDNPQPENAVETTLAPKKPPVLAIAACFLALTLTGSSIAFQLYLAFHPFSSTVTIIPKSQRIFFNGTVQLGRLLTPITLSQTGSAPTTGKGHQDAQEAQGTITFYNGLFTSQTVQAGTILTGADAVQIETSQDAVIPAANPPSLGQASVSVHAVLPGTKGNIPAYDINQACCATAIKAVNTTPLSGGADARNYQMVGKKDINTVSALLKASLAQSLNGALQGQVKAGEVLLTPNCTPTVTTDHQIGQEAAEVKVSVSLTCSGITYNTSELESRATQLLSIQAIKKLGTGYLRTGAIATSITKTKVAKGGVTLALSCQGTWAYQIKGEEIKESVAGKTVQEAERILRQTPSIKSATIENVADGATLPKQASLIRIVIFERS